MQTYPVSTIAKLLNLSERRVQQLSQDGIIPKSDKGNYNLIGSVRGYVKYLYDRAYGQNNDSIDSYAEKARLLKAQADRAEMELEIMRDKHITCEEVEYLWSGVIIGFRSKMLGLPSKLASRVSAVNGSISMIEELLQNEINEALTELAKRDYVQDYVNDDTNEEKKEASKTAIGHQEDSTAAEATS